MKRHDSAENGLAFVSTLAVLRHNSRTNFDFHSDFQDTSEDGATSNASFEFVDFGARFVDIERSDDNEAGIRHEVANRNGNSLDDVFVDSVNVVFQLGRYGYDGG